MLTRQQAGGVGLGDRELGGVIQTMHCLGALQRRAGLSDALGAFDRDSRQAADELIELVIDDATLIGDEGGDRCESTRTSC